MQLKKLMLILVIIFLFIIYLVCVDNEKVSGETKKIDDNRIIKSHLTIKKRSKGDLIDRILEVYNETGRIGYNINLNAKASSPLVKIQSIESVPGKGKQASPAQWFHAIRSLNEDIQRESKFEDMGRLAVNIDTGYVLGNGFIFQGLNSIKISLSATEKEAVKYLKSKGIDGYYITDNLVVLCYGAKLDKYVCDIPNGYKFKCKYVENAPKKFEKIFKSIETLENSPLHLVHVWDGCTKCNSTNSTAIYAEYTHANNFNLNKIIVESYGKKIDNNSVIKLLDKRFKGLLDNFKEVYYMSKDTFPNYEKLKLKN